MYVPILEIGLLSKESVIQFLCEGNQIIFVTEEEKFIGCITVGDIKRMLRSFDFLPGGGNTI